MIILAEITSRWSRTLLTFCLTRLNHLCHKGPHIYVSSHGSRDTHNDKHRRNENACVQISPNCACELQAFRVQSRPRDQLTLNRTTASKPPRVASRTYRRALRGFITKRNNVAQERDREEKKHGRKKRTTMYKEVTGQKGLLWSLGKLTSVKTRSVFLFFFPWRCLCTVCAVCGGQPLTWCAPQLLLPLIYFYFDSSIRNLNSGLTLVWQTLGHISSPFSFLEITMIYSLGWS